MSHEDSGWRPKGVTNTFDGSEIWDHGVHANEVNEAEVDGDLDVVQDE